MRRLNASSEEERGRLRKARDPVTGEGLTDDEIAGELMAFLVAGHDTTATTLAYALWALGHHRQIQDRVAAEDGAIGEDEE